MLAPGLGCSGGGPEDPEDPAAAGAGVPANGSVAPGTDMPRKSVPTGSLWRYVYEDARPTRSSQSTESSASGQPRVKFLCSLTTSRAASPQTSAKTLAWSCASPELVSCSPSASPTTRPLAAASRTLWQTATSRVASLLCACRCLSSSCSWVLAASEAPTFSSSSGDSTASGL